MTISSKNAEDKIPDILHLNEERVSGWLSKLLLVTVAIAISLPSLSSVRVDDLDSAHHLMDGIYFSDFFGDLPLLHPISYTLSYYKQYPALGFVFWPPLFPFIEGIFFRIIGIDVRVARLCILGFGILLAVTIQAVLRRQLEPIPRMIAVVLVLCTPLVAAFYQQVMLEIPALAMGLLVVFCYQRAVNGNSHTWPNVLLFAVVAAAALYTKQTTLFVLPAVAFDLFVNHRDLLRKRQLWLAILLLALLLAPLAVFTLTFGKANIVQSLGSDKSFVLNSNLPPNRWSAAGWLYYPLRLSHILNFVPIILGGCALLYGVRNTTFLRAHAIWFGWLFSWYLIFGYFLNKQDRYAVFWVAGWVVLAVLFVAELVKRKARIFQLSYLIFAIPLAAGVVGIGHIQIDGYERVEGAVAAILEQKPSGNILYLGDHRQVIVPFVRKLDASRSISVYQGDDLLAETADVSFVCRDYRVQFVVMETDDAQFADVFKSVSANRAFAVIGKYQLDTLHEPIRLIAFRYTGPMLDRAKPVPLKSRIIK